MPAIYIIHDIWLYNISLRNIRVYHKSMSEYSCLSLKWSNFAILFSHSRIIYIAWILSKENWFWTLSVPCFCYIYKSIQWYNLGYLHLNCLYLYIESLLHIEWLLELTLECLWDQLTRLTLSNWYICTLHFILNKSISTKFNNHYVTNIFV